MTDFRGSGLLGLENLHYYVTEADHNVEAKFGYEISQDVNT